MKKHSFDELLDGCLQEVVRTRDVEAVLQRHSECADELRPLLETALTAAEHYETVPDPPCGLVAGRVKFFHAASQQRERARTIASPIWKERRHKVKFTLVARLIGVILAVVMGTTAFGRGIALAANGSLPGDLIYPVKTGIEDLRLALAMTSEAKVALALQFVEERVEEIQELVERGRPLQEEIVARTGQQIQYALEQATSAPEEKVSHLLELVAEHTEKQAEALAQVEDRAPSEAHARLEHVQAAFLNGHDTAMGALSEKEPTIPPPTEEPTIPPPTEEPTIPPTVEPTIPPPTEEPTIPPPTVEPTVPPPTEEPTIAPTEEPTDDEDVDDGQAGDLDDGQAGDSDDGQAANLEDEQAGDLDDD